MGSKINFNKYKDFHKNHQKFKIKDKDIIEDFLKSNINNLILINNYSLATIFNNLTQPHSSQIILHKYKAIKNIKWEVQIINIKEMTNTYIKQIIIRNSNFKIMKEWYISKTNHNNLYKIIQPTIFKMKQAIKSLKLINLAIKIK